VSRTGLRWLPLGILGIGALGAWLLAQGRANGGATPPEAPLPALQVVEVVPQSVRVVVRAHGSVTPAREIGLVAEIGGRIEAISAALEPGSFFEADQVLVELERIDAELALERAEAALLRSWSERKLARARLARQRSLAEGQVASAVQIEEAEHAERSAQAGLREARAARDAARRDLSRTRIAAPFSGRVREKYVDAGQFVTRGTSLAVIHSVERAEVRLPVALAELARLGLSLAGGEVVDGPQVTLRARIGEENVAWAARIVRVEGEVALRSRMLHLVARVEDPFDRLARRGGPALAPGLFVEAEIEGRLLENAMVLPREAWRPPDEVVTVDAEGRLRSRRVTVMRLDAERVVVEAGLMPGERVLRSALGAMEGMRVRPVPADVAASPRRIGRAP
jgi:RND family efflux transporter MFP subunit